MSTTERTSVYISEMYTGKQIEGEEINIDIAVAKNARNQLKYIQISWTRRKQNLIAKILNNEIIQFSSAYIFRMHQC